MNQRHAPVWQKAYTLVLSCLVLLFPCVGAAQNLIDAEMAVVVSADSAHADVRLRYRLDAAQENAVPLKLLRFDGLTIESARAIVDGVVVGIDLRGDASVVHATVPLAGEPAERVVELFYRVHDTRLDVVGGRLRVPILATMWPPVTALPGTFRVSVVLPPGYAAWNAFPTTLRGTGTIGAQLAVLPSMIALDTGRRDRPLFTLANVFDASVLLLLLLFGAGGWRRYRSAHP